MKLKGQNILDIQTLKSVYDNNHILIQTDTDEYYRIDVREFLKIINDLEFSIEKKIKHKYLKIIGSD